MLILYGHHMSGFYCYFVWGFASASNWIQFWSLELVALIAVVLGVTFEFSKEFQYAGFCSIRFVCFFYTKSKKRACVKQWFCRYKRIDLCRKHYFSAFGRISERICYLLNAFIPWIRSSLEFKWFILKTTLWHSKSLQVWRSIDFKEGTSFCGMSISLNGLHNTLSQ